MSNMWMNGIADPKIPSKWWPYYRGNSGVITTTCVPGLTQELVYGKAWMSCPDSGTGLVSFIKDEIGIAVSMITSIFPGQLRKYIPALISAVVSIWTGGVLAGMIESAIPTLSISVANRIAQKIVDSVLSPDLFSQVRVPAIHDMNKFKEFVYEIMKPLDSLAAHGDPMDGAGKRIADAVYNIRVATVDKHLSSIKDLKLALNAAATMQSNLAVLLTVVFTNSLHVDYTRGGICVPSKIAGGWKPIDWFRWIESLPCPVYAPSLNINTGCTTRHLSAFGYRAAKRKHEVLLPFCGSLGWVRSKARRQRALDAFNAAAESVRIAQGSKNASRDALRVYFTGSGIPSKVADWIQSAIDGSPIARSMVKKESLVNVILQATNDAIRTAVKRHAKPLPDMASGAATGEKQVAKRAGKAKSLAPLLSSAMITAKLISSGVL